MKSTSEQEIDGLKNQLHKSFTRQHELNQKIYEVKEKLKNQVAENVSLSQFIKDQDDEIKDQDDEIKRLEDGERTTHLHKRLKTMNLEKQELQKRYNELTSKNISMSKTITFQEDEIKQLTSERNTEFNSVAGVDAKYVWDKLGNTQNRQKFIRQQAKDIQNLNLTTNQQHIKNQKLKDELISCKSLIDEKNETISGLERILQNHQFEYQDSKCKIKSLLEPNRACPRCESYDVEKLEVERQSEKVEGVAKEDLEAGTAVKEVKRYYEQIGTSIGKLVDEKNSAYGDSFHQAHKVLEVYWPNGIAVESYKDMLSVTRIIDKMFRIANKKDVFGENPYRDIAGYGILGSKEE